MTLHRVRASTSAIRWLIGGALLALALALSAARAEPVKVVAAEKVYGDIAEQIGGANVAVASILIHPNQDPHEFEASAATARSIADAKLVIYNGADYDPWAAKLVAASRSTSREVIEVARLLHNAPGTNPHVWYDTATVSALAAALSAKLTHLDPGSGPHYADRLAAFEASMAKLRKQIAALRAKYEGTAVTATEPVFDYMAGALGLTMRNGRFQLAVMNGTEPSAGSIAAFERDLRTRSVKLLFYNAQTGQALAERMRAIARESGVPVVSVTETEPDGQRYQEWMATQLDALDRALGNR
jgi:zinc/manganese transport system substrate-binding protein